MTNHIHIHIRNSKVKDDTGNSAAQLANSYITKINRFSVTGLPNSDDPKEVFRAVAKSLSDLATFVVLCGQAIDAIKKSSNVRW